MRKSEVATKRVASSSTKFVTVTSIFTIVPHVYRPKSGGMKTIKTVRATCASCGKDGASFATNCKYKEAMDLLTKGRKTTAFRTLGQWYCGKCIKGVK